MNKVIHADFDGFAYRFADDGWFDATTAAKRFGKHSHEWLRLPETKRYIQALENRCGKIPLLKIERGGRGKGGATWMHPKLAVRFAQWLDMDFAVWCDEQIDTMIRDGYVHTSEAGISLWQQRLQIKAWDKSSLALASMGSHFMLDRKSALSAIRPERERIENQMQPPLFH